MAARKKAKKTLTIEPVKRKRGRPKMTEEQKADARAKREAAKQYNAAGEGAVAAAPTRRRGRPPKVDNSTVELLTQQNAQLAEEVTVLRRMLVQVYAEAAQALA